MVWNLKVNLYLNTPHSWSFYKVRMAVTPTTRNQLQCHMTSKSVMEKHCWVCKRSDLTLAWEQSTNEGVMEVTQQKKIRIVAILMVSKIIWDVPSFNVMDKTKKRERIKYIHIVHLLYRYSISSVWQLLHGIWPKHGRVI